jgi:CO/xanthine dehydrogenase FAD-binding subunit
MGALMPVTVPTSLHDALTQLSARPHATLLAGGTDVMVETNFGHRRPTDVIALRQVEELRRWHHDPAAAMVRVGAGVPWAAMEGGELARLVPALAQAARTVGSPQIRAAGTLGGNLATSSPAGDGLPVLWALEATVEVASSSGVRRVPATAFTVGVKRHVLQPGEMITAVECPVVRGWQGYAKVGPRNAMVISVVSACLVLDRDAGTVHLALGAVGPTVIRCHDTEGWLADQLDLRTAAVLPHDVAAETARRVSAEARPIDDHRSTAEYRRHAVGVLGRRLLERAITA